MLKRIIDAYDRGIKVKFSNERAGILKHEQTPA